MLTFREWCEQNDVRPAPVVVEIAESVLKQMSSGEAQTLVVLGPRYGRSLIRRWLESRDAHRGAGQDAR
mgnify:CR=1 FL=1